MGVNLEFSRRMNQKIIMKWVKFIFVLFPFPLGSHLLTIAYSCPCVLLVTHVGYKDPKMQPVVSDVHPHQHQILSILVLLQTLFPCRKMNGGRLIREMILMNTLARWYVTSHT